MEDIKELDLKRILPNDGEIENFDFEAEVPINFDPYGAAASEFEAMPFGRMPIAGEMALGAEEIASMAGMGPAGMLFGAGALGMS